MIPLICCIFNHLINLIQEFLQVLVEHKIFTISNFLNIFCDIDQFMLLVCKHKIMGIIFYMHVYVLRTENNWKIFLRNAICFLGNSIFHSPGDQQSCQTGCDPCSRDSLLFFPQNWGYKHKPSYSTFLKFWFYELKLKSLCLQGTYILLEPLFQTHNNICNLLQYLNIIFLNLSYFILENYYSLPIITAVPFIKTYHSIQ